MRYHRALAARHYRGGVDAASYFQGQTLKSVLAILLVVLASIIGLGLTFMTH